MFSESDWTDIVDRAARFVKLDAAESERLLEHRLLKLTAAIPFLAECRQPERTALQHVVTYLLAAREPGKDIYSHTTADHASLFARLERISHFDGGRREIIDRGMNLLALCMLEDYQADQAQDRQADRINPVADGVWDYIEVKQDLAAKINAVACPEMDAIMQADESEKIFWEI